MDYAYTTQNSLGWHKIRNRKAARPLKHPPPETCCRREPQKVSFANEDKTNDLCKYQNKRNQEINFLVFFSSLMCTSDYKKSPNNEKQTFVKRI